jgi:hypothetical protein
MADLVFEVAQQSSSYTAAGDRVKLSAYQWLAEKLDHAKYGARSTTAITGRDGGPIEVKRSAGDFSDDELAAIAAASGGGAAESPEGEE